MIYRFGRKEFSIQKDRSKWAVWRLYASGAQKLVHQANSETEAMAWTLKAAADEVRAPTAKAQH